MGRLIGKASRAIVIGTGPGGAACAALLSKEGFEVVVLERNPFPGGKCATFRYSKLPIANLYQVGSDAGGRGVGTKLAVDSALRLARDLTQKS